MKRIIAIAFISILLPALVRAQDCMDILNSKHGYHDIQVGVQLTQMPTLLVEIDSADAVSNADADFVFLFEARNVPSSLVREKVLRVFQKPDENHTYLRGSVNWVHYYFFNDTLIAITAVDTGLYTSDIVRDLAAAYNGDADYNGNDAYFSCRTSKYDIDGSFFAWEHKFRLLVEYDDWYKEAVEALKEKLRSKL
jgi:hypothetical protein